MSDSLQFRVEGIEEVRGMLRRFGKEGVKMLRRGMWAGGAIIRNEVRAQAPVAAKPHKRGGRLVPPGTTKKAPVSLWARELSDATDQVFMVTLRRGKKYQRMGKKEVSKDAYYWPWVEYGHKSVPRKAKAGSQGISARRRVAGGMVQPHPFFNPAFEASKARASARIAERLSEEITKAIEAEK